MVLTGAAAATGAVAQSVPDPQAAALASAAFAPRGAAASDLDQFSRSLERDSFIDGAGGPVRWSSSEVQLSSPAQAGHYDSLRVSVGGVLATPGGLPLNLDRSQFDAKSYEVAVIRNWPAAVSFETKQFGVDVSPHAGVGVGNLGGSAEAGAELRLSKPKSRDERSAEALQNMGVGDGAAFGDTGRWYLYAAASGRAVGLNMLRNDSGWNRAGWTTDPTSALMGDAQVGVGFRKGSVQSSFGYIHREVKGQHMVFGQKTYEDSLVAFSFSIRPGK